MIGQIAGFNLTPCSASNFLYREKNRPHRLDVFQSMCVRVGLNVSIRLQNKLQSCELTAGQDAEPFSAHQGDYSDPMSQVIGATALVPTVAVAKERAQQIA